MSIRLKLLWAIIALGVIAGVVSIRPWLDRRRDVPDSSSAPGHGRHLIQQGDRGMGAIPSGSSPAVAAGLRQWLESTLQLLNAETDLSRRDELAEEIVAQIPDTDLPDAVALLLDRSGEENSRDLGLRLLHRWAGREPRVAADWLERSALASKDLEMVKLVAAAWAGNDFTASAAWVRQLGDEDARRTGMIAVAYEAARDHPDAALGLALELRAGSDRDELVTHVTAQWAARAPDAAAAWAVQIEDTSLRERVVAKIAAAWGETDPFAAASLAVGSLTPGRLRDDAVVGIVQRWVQNAPEDAAGWVSRFPEGRLRDDAMDNVVKIWADRDAEAVGAWIAGLEASPSRDQALGVYVGKMANTQPESAAHWAEQIADEAMRHRQMEKVGESWLNLDAPAASNWIAQAAMPESAKTRLLHPRRE